MSDVQLGIYRHYKGPLYQVLGIAHDANSTDLIKHIPVISWARSWFRFGRRDVVVYMPLQLDGAHFGPRMAVRTLDDFTDWVCGDAAHELYGQHASTGSCMVRRFTYLGPELTAEMLA